MDDLAHARDGGVQGISCVGLVELDQTIVGDMVTTGLADALIPFTTKGQHLDAIKFFGFSGNGVDIITD